MAEFFEVEKIHSSIARHSLQEKTLRGLGLTRRHQKRVLKKTPAIYGMAKKIAHLVRVRDLPKGESVRKEKIETYRLGELKPAEPSKRKQAVAKKASKPKAEKMLAAKS